MVAGAEAEELISTSKKNIKGANLKESEYGNTPLFGNFFFFITGFHGFHVFSGVVINIIVFILVWKGFLERKRDYELVEKVGLYWHFVDLVWVFVFTFFYLV
jgi:cytochrome c oxidase subunit 3